MSLTPEARRSRSAAAGRTAAAKLTPDQMSAKMATMRAVRGEKQRQRQIMARLSDADAARYIVLIGLAETGQANQEELIDLARLEFLAIL